MRDYLGLAPTDVTDWQFVEVRDVPPGPWRSYGENNHFVLARRQFEQRAREQVESEKITKKEQGPSGTPVDTGTTKKWSIKNREEMGHRRLQTLATKTQKGAVTEKVAVVTLGYN